MSESLDASRGSFRTENGFYLGDAVDTPDGRRGCIDEIVVPTVFWLSIDGLQTGTVVRLDDEHWVDWALTRV